MHWRFALAVGVVAGLGFAAWVERERLATLTGVALEQLPNTAEGVEPPPEMEAAESQPAGHDGFTLAGQISLDQLFGNLRMADSLEEAQAVEQQLFGIIGRAQSPTVNALMQAASIAEDAGDLPRARDLYRRVNSLEPDYAEGYVRAAAAHHAAGDPTAALRDLEIALRIEPRHFGALIGLATVQEEQGQLEEALDHYKEALYWHPWLDPAKRGIRRLGTRLEGLAL